VAGRKLLNTPLDRIGRNSESLADDRNSAPADFQRFPGSPVPALNFIESLTNLPKSLIEVTNYVVPVHGAYRLSDFIAFENRPFLQLPRQLCVLSVEFFMVFSEVLDGLAQRFIVFVLDQFAAISRQLAE
jgi:hypothetical protein